MASTVLTPPEGATIHPEDRESFLEQINRVVDGEKDEGMEFRYSPEDKLIDFTLTLGKDSIVLRIQDRGIGIPVEDRSHLLKSFYRGRNVGTITGTGLGLAIVDRCIKLHGGDLAFESEVDLGTTFTVIVPLC